MGHKINHCESNETCGDERARLLTPKKAKENRMLVAWPGFVSYQDKPDAK
jgi:hypothetical protein